MGAILTPEWLSQPPALTPLRPEYAAVASVCVVGDGNVNLAPVTSANRIVPAVSVTRVAGPAGGGWRSDGTTAPYRNVGKVEKFRGPEGLTLVYVFSSTDTSAIQYVSGIVSTATYQEVLAVNRKWEDAQFGASKLYCDLRPDGAASPAAVYGTPAATAFFDGKPHCVVVQWTVASAASVPVARMWVDGVEQTLTTNGSGAVYSQAAGLTEYDYYLNTRNLRGSPSASINGIKYLFARLMSARFDGKSLSANPWQMFDASELDIYLADAGGAIYSSSITESLALSDGPASAAILAASASESISAADIISAALIGAAAASEAISLADAPSAAAIRAAAMAESMTLADAPASAAIYAASVTDALTLADIGSLGLIADISEAMALSDAATATLIAASAVSELITLADAGSGAAVRAATALESLSLTDSVAAAGIFASSVVDALALADLITASGSGGPVIATDLNYLLKYPSGGFYILRPRNNWTIQ